METHTHLQGGHGGHHMGHEGHTIEKQTFPVMGMSCASCASSVESMLKAQKGVLKAAVNFAANTVLVEYDKQAVKPEDLKKTVQSIGYDLVLKNEHGDEHEGHHHGGGGSIQFYNELKRKTIFSFILSLPVVIIAMFLHHSIPYGNWIMMILSMPVIFWFGKNFFVKGFKRARHFQANMDTLVALSTGVAFVFSAFNTIYPDFLIQRGLEPHVYFETAAVIITFILFGKMLEERAKTKASSAIEKLMGLQPKTVKVIRNGEER